MSGGRDSHPNTIKMSARTKLLYDLNYEQNAVRVRNIPSCVPTSSITSWVKIREALPMHGFGLLSAKKVPKLFLTIVLDGLVRHPNPHLL